MSGIVRHAVLTDHGPWPAVKIVSGPHGTVADLCIQGGDGVTIFARTDLDGLLRVRDAINAVEAEYRSEAGALDALRAARGMEEEDR